MGSVQFEMLGPFKNDFLNYIRTVHASFDGSRWVFDAVGTPQDFEELDAYKAPRVRDRFTSEMLERYCKALGVDVFNPQAYGPRAVLARSPVVPRIGKVMTLDEVHALAGDFPGHGGRTARVAASATQSARRLGSSGTP
jgi:hypothetical protein